METTETRFKVCLTTLSCWFIVAVATFKYYFMFLNNVRLMEMYVLNALTKFKHSFLFVIFLQYINSMESDPRCWGKNSVFFSCQHSSQYNQQKI